MLHLTSIQHNAAFSRLLIAFLNMKHYQKSQHGLGALYRYIKHQISQHPIKYTLPIFLVFCATSSFLTFAQIHFQICVLLCTNTVKIKNNNNNMCTICCNLLRADFFKSLLYLSKLCCSVS